ncbi:MAG: TrpB-like pyridoxal phosphate-dependent enzyme [archaeon]
MPVEDLPKHYYNILPDLPEELPFPLNPGTMQPVKPQDFEVLFPKECIKQEFSSESFIRIPEELREQYIFLGRPRPLYRALRLEKKLSLPKGIEIYYKREDLSPVGSHKPNTALAQAYYGKKQGFENVSTETGAGQWGSAVSLAAMFNELKAEVFMVRSSFLQKPYREILMNLFGAKVFASPSENTNIGKQLLKEKKNFNGSLGIAISEAIEKAATNEKTFYSIGSVLNHVLMHQTIIGLETIKQFESIDKKPDVLIGCVGGGSNFSGMVYPFMKDKLKGKEDFEVIAVEPKAVPTLTKGEYRYDFGDTGKMTPLIKMYTVGYDFIPEPIHAGGLRYHGDSPSLSLLKKLGFMKAVAYNQKETFEAARLFANSEGIIPAPETAHAINAAIDCALKAKKEKQQKIIAFNFSGHGLLDLAAYKQMQRA